MARAPRHPGGPKQREIRWAMDSAKLLPGVSALPEEVRFGFDGVIDSVALARV